MTVEYADYALRTSVESDDGTDDLVLYVECDDEWLSFDEEYSDTEFDISVVCEL